MPLPPTGSADLAGRTRPSAEGHRPVGEPRSESFWISRQVDAMAASWARGEPVTAERILAENPEIGDEDAVRLIYEEICLRRELGQDVPTSEIVARFPRWKDEIEVLLGCDRLLRPMSMIATLPEIGEELGPFRLLAELGRGASGKTYLAEEPALADRLVVLKVISDDQEEHLSLARLQHTHIIPLFSEHAFPDRGLRRSACPIWAGRAWPGSWRHSRRFHRPNDAAMISSRSWTAWRPAENNRRCPMGRIADISSGRRTFRRSAGSGPASPMPCMTRTPTAWFIWT